MKTIRTFRGRNTTKITNLWKGLKFMYHDHTQFYGKIRKKKKGIKQNQHYRYQHCFHKWSCASAELKNKKKSWIHPLPLTDLN